MIFAIKFRKSCDIGASHVILDFRSGPESREKFRKNVSVQIANSLSLALSVLQFLKGSDRILPNPPCFSDFLKCSRPSVPNSSSVLPSLKSSDGNVPNSPCLQDFVKSNRRIVANSS
jgi:hypothetical protein